MTLGVLLVAVLRLEGVLAVDTHVELLAGATR